ncbi:MAG: hypothetical protein K8R44_00345 [Sulfurimonas sp.]|nr:hypothetical protein [Sulfurimonas sp.]
MNEPSKYKKEGAFFFFSLEHALTYGISHFGEDTKERKEFIENNEHLYAGTMLVALFSYLESTLGRTWISRCGGRKKSELEILRFVRNAFIHCNSHIRDLNSHSEYEEKRLRKYISNLKAGNIEDEKGNIYPVYIDITDEGVITLKKSAIHVFKVYRCKLSH